MVEVQLAYTRNVAILEGKGSLVKADVQEVYRMILVQHLLGIKWNEAIYMNKVGLCPTLKMSGLVSFYRY